MYYRMATVAAFVIMNNPKTDIIDNLSI